MTSYILLVAAVILLCLSLNKMSNKLGIPMLLAYILLGMMFGTDGILKLHLYGVLNLYHVLRWIWNQLETGKAGGW